MIKSFIEQQFPVSKVSKESYKERKSSQGQTITGLGKWWGRKPLILVRATILGCLMPASENPAKDMEIFQKILSIDDNGVLSRKEKRISAAEIFRIVNSNKELQTKYSSFLNESSERIRLSLTAPKVEIEEAAFKTLGYDARIALCKRPEQLNNLSSQTWNEINHHLGTHAKNHMELVNELSIKRFGHNVVIGDCFCGGGSIPFEAARLGCETYGSDLNPIAGLLSWGDIHICGASKNESNVILEFQKQVFASIDKEICRLGVEHNELGDRALSYLYCAETVCPECGWKIPLLPSLVVGIRAGRVVAILHEADKSYAIEIMNGATDQEVSIAQSSGTVRNNNLVCPHCKKATPIASIRHDFYDRNGNIENNLRKWSMEDFQPKSGDVYSERLYAVRYEHIEKDYKGNESSSRYYRSPNQRDLLNEHKVESIVANNFSDWQEKGFIPDMKIEAGIKTDEPIRTRGWTYWHQLFNTRQLLLLSMFVKEISIVQDQKLIVAGLLGLNKCADFNSKLCRWNPNCDKTEQTFYNQALNPLFNWGARSLTMLSTLWFRTPGGEVLNNMNTTLLADAREVNTKCDLWITDPPYADAVTYDQLSEFFLSWDKVLIKQAFPEWYSDSKRVLAVRGDEHFSQTMIDIYSNLTKHMSDEGMQVVMFTHSDPAVWAQLALIMWKSGLTVTAAWNIATEIDASGLKDGNYVKGTVLLVLRKQQGDTEAFLDELTSDIKQEVKRQIESMQKLDDKEEPNFSDPDYVLAAYAASLKVLTGYKSIGEIDLDYELSLAINNPTKSEVVKLIERAKKIAYDCIIPLNFDHLLWKDLSPAERFYIKGLEAEKRGSYQISTFQEYARGFGLSSYSQLMASEKANTARLKTPVEFGMRNINEITDFEQSRLRLVFAAIYIAVKEDENPEKGLWHIKNNLTDYWNNRDVLKQLLSFLKDTQNIDNMPHWAESAQMAEHIYILVDNDRI